MPELDQQVNAIIEAAREHVRAGMEAVDGTIERYTLTQAELEHRREVMAKLAIATGRPVYAREAQRHEAAIEEHARQTAPLRCSACGERIRSVCDCGVAYLPSKLLRAARKGRKPIGGRAMTAAERQRRHRQRK